MSYPAFKKLSFLEESNSTATDRTDFEFPADSSQDEIWSSVLIKFMMMKDKKALLESLKKYYTITRNVVH